MMNDNNLDKLISGIDNPSTTSPAPRRSHSTGRREDRLTRFPQGQKVYMHHPRDKQGNLLTNATTLPIRRAEGDEKRVRKELGLSKKQWKKMKRREREETDRLWRDEDTIAVAQEYKRELKEQASKKEAENGTD